MAGQQRGRLLGLLSFTQAAIGCHGLAQKQYPPLLPYNVTTPKPSVQLPLTSDPPVGQSVSDRAEALRPIAWLHFPKDGSSFLNAIFATPTICPNMPEGAWLPPDDEQIAVSSIPPKSEGPVPHILGRYPVDVYCPGAFSNSFTEYDGRNHATIGGTFAQNQGRIVGMFRQPEQRMISAFNFHLDPHRNWQYPKISNLSLYAQIWQGCHVKMLVRPAGSPCFDPLDPPPTANETALAVQRVRTGFAFVGILEQWELSICLWHAMFGGYCYDREVSNSRLGPKRNSSHSLYNTSGLNGFVDPADGAVYAEAVKIFNENLKRFGVPQQNCRAACAPPPGH